MPEFWLRAKWMPLHGALIQVISMGGLDPELAGRLISAVSASLLYFPLKALSERLGRCHPWALCATLAFAPLVGRYAGLVLNDLMFCLWLILALASFLLHGRLFPLWWVLAILTRPEGWILFPFALVWHAYARGGLWISIAGCCTAFMWMWGRNGSFALGQEFAGGVMGGDWASWLHHALSTLVLVLLMAWPVLLDFKWKTCRLPTGRGGDLTVFVLGLVFVLLWILPSLTSTWSGRRSLPLILLLTPWMAGALARLRISLGIWLVLSIAGSVGVYAGLKQEHADLKAACRFVRQENRQGTVYVDDIRRCQWWLKPIPDERVRVWKGEKPGPDDVLVLWNRRRPLPSGEAFVGFQSTLNLFGDGIWQRGGGFVSQEPPRWDEWCRWSVFETRVYLR
ncbi:MAG: hypothetical protein AB7F75_08860 [Planctomycetota bacterium]